MYFSTFKREQKCGDGMSTLEDNTLKNSKL